MKYRYRIVTPFSRWQNVVQFSEFIHSLGVHWHPIFDQELPFRVQESSWLHPFYTQKWCEGFAHMGNFKFDRWLDGSAVDDEARHILLNDDDWLEPGFLDKVDAVEGEVLIVSLLRGQHQPPTGPQYGTSTLIACQDNLKPGLISSQQIVVTGKIMKQYRMGPGDCADGDYICQICLDHPPVFLPDVFAWFNYLEPGRWEPVASEKVKA